MSDVLKLQGELRGYHGDPSHAAEELPIYSSRRGRGLSVAPPPSTEANVTPAFAF